MKKCCFVIPYFGNFPNYFPLFLKSCSYNIDFNWLIITDNDTNYEYPANFRVIKMTFAEMKSLFQTKFDFTIVLDHPYKLCDYKPAYGYLFEEFLTEYEFWGHCDVDTLMGDLSKFLTSNIFETYDKIFCLGHMTIYKNSKENNRVFMSDFKGRTLYKYVFSTNKICWFDEESKDEYNINQIFLSKKKKIFTLDVSLNINVLPTKFVRTRYVGNDIYPLHHGYYIEDYIKSIYLWNDGHIQRYLMNHGKLIKEEFAYIHLQRRKMSVSSQLHDSHCIKIVANRFLPFEFSSVTDDNFYKIKTYYPNMHFFYIKIKPKIKIILHMLNIKILRNIL